MKHIQIPGFEHYLINEDGRIYTTINSKGKKLLEPVERKTYPNKNNKYLQVIFQNKGKGIKPTLLYVHRLVAQHYIPNPNNYPEVNHINFDRADNSVENLEWVTRRGNIKHALSNTAVRNSKFRRIIIQDELIRKGIEHYVEHRDVKYLTELWDACMPMCWDILRHFNIKLRKGRNRKHKLD